MALRRRIEQVTAAALCWLLLSAVAGAAPGAETVIVHGAGSSSTVQAVEPWEPLDQHELEALVGPVALYPDDLLAIVLPASTFPLQIVQAARYLEALEGDPSLQPDEDWDESVIALLNYPEVVEKLNEDLDWTWDLGQAVLEQEQDLLAAVDAFRRQAHSTGNLTSDDHQRVDVGEHAVAIRPADPTVIYVPYYEPALMRVRHPYRVYRYYPRPCPVYYYPYPSGHYLTSRYFWGVTSAFSIGWQTRHLHFHLLEHRSHPYYGYSYAFRHYRYWQPRLLAGTYYRDHPTYRHHPGNRWRPEHPYRGARPAPRLHPEERQRALTRPPAAEQSVPRLRRYRDDGDVPRISRSRSREAAERMAERAESMAPRAEPRIRRAAAPAAQVERPGRVSAPRARLESRPRSAPARIERQMRRDAPAARVQRQAEPRAEAAPRADAAASSRGPSRSGAEARPSPAESHKAARTPRGRHDPR